MKPTPESEQRNEPRAETCNPHDGRPFCPRCHSPAEERKQKWFCIKCKQLVMTCCD